MKQNILDFVSKLGKIDNYFLKENFFNENKISEEELLDLLLFSDLELKKIIVKKIICFLEKEIFSKEMRKEALLLLAKNSFTPEKEIRVSILLILQKYAKKDLNLSLTWYEYLLKAMDFECEETTLIIIDIFYLLSPISKKIFLSLKENKKITMEDHLFIIMCNQMTSHFSSIRQKASLFLSLLENTSKSLIKQALYKTKIDQKEKNPKKTVYHRIKDFNASQESQTNNTLGSFVHGIEDEFYLVRKNTLNSILLFAKKDDEIFSDSLDLIIDSLNDSEITIRQLAMVHLQELSKIFQITLGCDHLSEFLFALGDSSKGMRKGIRDILKRVKLYDKEKIKTILDALITCASQNKEELEDTLHCLKNIGENNKDLLILFHKEKLEKEDKYLKREGSIFDPKYLCKLVLHVCFYSSQNMKISREKNNHLRALNWKYPSLFLKTKSPFLDLTTSLGCILLKNMQG